MAARPKPLLHSNSLRPHSNGLDTPTLSSCLGKMRCNNVSQSLMWQRFEPCKRPLIRTC